MRRPSLKRSLAAASALAALTIAGLAACNSSPAPAPKAPAPAAPTPAAPQPYAPAPALPNGAVAAQVQHGASLYATSCAQCHGAQGQGAAAPALIGPGALPTNPPAGRQMRTGAFRSAMDIGMFIKNSMPPGSHTPPDQVAAILAYLLQSNGTTPSQPINPAAAGAIPWNR